MILTSTLSQDALPGLETALRVIQVRLVRHPLLRLAPARERARLDALLEDLHSFGTIALTSPRATSVLARRAVALGIGPDALPPIWAIGPATAAGLGPLARVRIPDEPGDGATLARAMLRSGVTGPVLHLAGEEHRPELAAVLQSAGLAVAACPAYRMELAKPEAIRAALAAATFLLAGSHRVIRALAAAGPRERPELITLGSATARTARELGWEPAAVARSASAAGVVEAVLAASASGRT